MAAPTVFNHVTEEFNPEGVSQLFASKKFWVAQRVPTRNRLLAEIKANGGEIVQLEKKADYRIADHFRKDCPPGSISYEFVEKSIQEGRICDPEAHRAGPPPGEAREPGAINRPTKGGRAYYTPEEDIILYKWVRDCEAVGGLASGNAIYKQLEAKHPRHTWQSWRNRYLKQLRDRPLLAFNIPDNALPSPPSDTPAKESRSVPSSSTQDKQAKSRLEQSQAAKRVSGQGGTRDKVGTEADYSLDQLAATFNSNDWEELYAFVDIIDALKAENRHDEAWKQWTEPRKNQTAEQWRQYYEKVVRPQWLRDPEWKRAQIRNKVKKKDEDNPSPTLSITQPQLHDLHEHEVEAATASASHTPQEETLASPKPSELEDERFENERLEILRKAIHTNDDDAAAYVFYSRDKKWSTWNSQPGLDYTQLHTLLRAQWELLSAEAKALYLAMNQATQKYAQTEIAKLPSKEKPMSSSTAQPESPKYIAEFYPNVHKRVRKDELTGGQEEQVRPSKRQKSASSTISQAAQQHVQNGTLKQPVKIISSDSLTSTSQPEADDERVNDQIWNDIAQRQKEYESRLDRDYQEAVKKVESAESDDFLDIERLVPPLEGVEESSKDELPLNTPTPRAARQRTNNFETQAILSSPSQEISISVLPRPVRYTQDLQTQTEDRSSSLAPHPESEASTTQSLQEFRHSLNEEGAQPSYPTLKGLPRPAFTSPAPSTSSSTGSGDPDPPLMVDEFDDFFSEQYVEGFNDDFITKALKRTRCRPGLAEIVLEAWKVGKPLPKQRGIWSLEDDAAVESGDGVALAKLERKHTLDGWGGITERLKFLEGYRSR